MFISYYWIIQCARDIQTYIRDILDHMSILKEEMDKITKFLTIQVIYISRQLMEVVGYVIISNKMNILNYYTLV